MKRMFRMSLVIAICSLVLSGCFTATLGENYQHGSYVTSDPDEAWVIVYVDAAVDAGLTFRVWTNDDGRGLVFPNTFKPVSVSPGDVDLRIWEQLAGNTLKEPVPESYTMIGKQFSFRSGETHPLTVRSGETRYIRISKQSREIFIACAEDKETTTVCSRQEYKTLIEQVAGETAAAELSTMRESL